MATHLAQSHNFLCAPSVRVSPMCTSALKLSFVYMMVKYSWRKIAVEAVHIIPHKLIAKSITHTHSCTHKRTHIPVQMRVDTLKGKMNCMTAASACVYPECQTSCSYTNRYARTDAHTHSVHAHTHSHGSQTDAAVWESVSIDTRQHVLYNKHCPRKRCTRPVRERDTEK